MSKNGKTKWQIEVSGTAEEKPLVKKFGSREEAETWRRDVVQGREPPVELKSIK